MPLISCPACSGSGTYYNQDALGYAVSEPCISCHGSGKLELTPAQMQRRERDMAAYEQKVTNRRNVRTDKWSDAEKAIVNRMGDLDGVIADMEAAGYRRTPTAIYRMRYKIKHGMIDVNGNQSIIEAAGR